MLSTNGVRAIQLVAEAKITRRQEYKPFMAVGAEQMLGGGGRKQIGYS